MAEPSRAVLTFNSLFEMHYFVYEFVAPDRARPFNSLFEMLHGPKWYGMKSPRNLSILYLRCSASVAQAIAAVYAFNSLFEMRHGEVLRA